jgi:hypothetical protein
MAHEEMESALVRLAELQQDNQVLLRESLRALANLNGWVVNFAEVQNTSLLRVESAVVSLARQVEAFVRGSHNGGKQ